MSTKEKRIESMRNNPKDCSMDDVEWLLCDQAGCVKRKGKSSHFRFRHPSLRPATSPDGICVPFKRPIKKCYVEDALAYYDALADEEEGLQ